MELWHAQLLSDQIPQKAKEAIEACYDKIKHSLLEQLTLDLKNKCNYVGTILLLFSLIGQIEFAISNISNSVVAQEIEEKISSDTCITKDIILRNLFNEIFIVIYFFDFLIFV